MPIRWSRIHSELGLQLIPLTYEMIGAAVAARIREAADLDWKGALISAEEVSSPGKQKALDDRRKEFAKDVAAMANTQGGLIVYGVTDLDVAGGLHSMDQVGHIAEGPQQSGPSLVWCSGRWAPSPRFRAEIVNGLLEVRHAERIGIQHESSGMAATLTINRSRCRTAWSGTRWLAGPGRGAAQAVVRDAVSRA